MPWKAIQGGQLEGRSPSVRGCFTCVDLGRSESVPPDFLLDRHP